MISARRFPFSAARDAGDMPGMVNAANALS
jgi:hypothetical protein